MARSNAEGFSVAVLDDYQRVAAQVADWSSLTKMGANVQFFHDHVTDDALLNRLVPFRCVVAMRERTRFDEALIRHLPNLELLASTGVHNDAIDLDAADRHGLLVVGTRSPSAVQATLEHTWALILGVARSLSREDAVVRQGRWQTDVGILLSAKRLGIVGFGRIGRMNVPIAKAFGMEVVAWSRSLRPEQADAAGVNLVSRDELFATSDVITVHLRLTPQTVGFITHEDLQRMKSSALLINTSRGPIIDEDALTEALENRSIRAAALDVFHQEPLPSGHPFLRFDNVLLSPHVGYVTDASYGEYYGEVVANIVAYLSGAPVAPMVRR